MFAMLVHVHVLHSHSLFLCVCFPRFRMFLLTVKRVKQKKNGWNPNIMLDTCQTHQTPGPNCKSMRPTKENVLRKTVSTPSRQNNLRLREQTLTSLIQRYLRLRQQTLTSFSQTGARKEEASPNGGNPHPPQQLW